MELPIHTSFLKQEAQDENIDINLSSLSDIEITIISLIKNSPLSKKEISEELGYKSIPGNIKRALKKLLDKDLITYTIPDSPTSKYQKYKINKQL